VAVAVVNQASQVKNTGATSPQVFVFSGSFTPSAGSRLLVFMSQDLTPRHYTAAALDGTVTTCTEVAAGSSSKSGGMAFISDELSGTMPTQVTLSGDGSAASNIIIVAELTGADLTSGATAATIELIRTGTTGAATGIALTGTGTVTDTGSLSVGVVATNSTGGTQGVVTGWTQFTASAAWSNISCFVWDAAIAAGSSPDVTLTWTTAQYSWGCTFTVRPVVTSGTPIGADEQSVWSVNALIGSDEQATWDLNALISAAEQAVWDLSTAIGADEQAIWNLDAFVGIDEQITWNVLVLALAGADEQAVWSINASVSADEQTVWDVLVNLTAIGADEQAIWDTYSPIGTSEQIVWDALVSIWVDEQAVWDTNAPVGTSEQAVWDLIAFV